MGRINFYGTHELDKSQIFYFFRDASTKALMIFIIFVLLNENQ